VDDDIHVQSLPVRKHDNEAENSGFTHYIRLMEILGEVHNVNEYQNIGGHNIEKTLKLKFSISNNQLADIMKKPILVKIEMINELRTF
jgi:hypothetical protein